MTVYEDATAPDGFWPSLDGLVDPHPPYPVVWHLMSTGERLAALDDLADWVGWLVDRYPLDSRSVPDCWELHGELIEELSALRTAWLRAFDVDALGDAPLRWHEQLEHSRARLGDWVARTGCRGGSHRIRTETR